MTNGNDIQPAGEDSTNEGEGQSAEAQQGYSPEERFGFCPQKELNLPANYDEVVERFKRLQAGRAMESLN